MCGSNRFRFVSKGPSVFQILAHDMNRIAASYAYGSAALQGIGIDTHTRDTDTFVA